MVKWGHQDRALIHETIVRIPWEGSHQQTRQRGFTRNQAWGHLDLNSGWILVFKPSTLIFCYRSWTDQCSVSSSSSLRHSLMKLQQLTMLWLLMQLLPNIKLTIINCLCKFLPGLLILQCIKIHCSYNNVRFNTVIIA